MYLSDFWSSLARRWYLVIACLIASAGLAYYVSQSVAPTYESTADVVLVPPKSVEDPTSNRYLSLSGLRQAVDVLTRSLGSDSTQDVVEKIAPDGEFETTADATTSAPILIVKAKADSPARAQRLLDAVVEQIPVNLRALQDSLQIAKKYQITPQMVASDEKPKAVNKKQIRAVGAIAGFSLLMSAMLVGAVDNRLLRREKAREAEEQEALLEKDNRNPQGNADNAAGPTAERPAPETGKRDVVSAKARR